MNTLKQAFIVVLAALVFQQQTLAELPGARLIGSGSVNVNGQPVPTSTVLFQGDLIQVNQGSRAVVQQADLTAYLEPQTQAKYLVRNGNGGLQVLSGTGTIALKDKSASVLFRDLRATAKTPGARAVFGLEHGRPALMASNGDLLVTQGNKTMTLAEGSALVAKQDAGTNPTGVSNPQDQNAPPVQTAPPPPPADQPPPPPVANQQPVQNQISPQQRSEDEYCSEENQNKDKKRRKKCAGVPPESGFDNYNLVVAAVIAGAILFGALYAFGAFDSTSTSVSPKAP